MRISARPLLCTTALFVFASPIFAQSYTIDFEDFAGPSHFDAAQPPVQVLSATVSGGEVLRNSALAPAGVTAVYGTSNECSGCSPDISIRFNQPVSNVQLSYYSAQPFNVSYATTDAQGAVNEASLSGSVGAGSGTVNLPAANISQVTLSSSSTQFSMAVNAVTFATTGSPVLIDPVVAGLLSGNAVTTNVNTIAAATTGLVSGGAADGTTQIVLRIPVSTTGQITVTVFNDSGGTSMNVGQDGGLMPLGGTSAPASTLVVSAVSTTSFGAEGFVIYRVPVNFSRGSADNSLATRKVTLQVTPAGGTTTSTTVTVARPPVVLVHGLWGNASSFNNFTPLINDTTIFNISRAVYANAITGVTSTTPSFSKSVDSAIEANSLGFAYNAPSVLTQVNNFIAAYRTSANVASVKADIVAHSMGGDISRTMLLLPAFLSSTTFGAGPINKLMTIATPHLGTPVAADLLASSNACARNVLASDGDIALQTINFSGGTADGAVYDLEGSGTGSSLSPALNNLKPSQPHFPTAYIAGIATSSNLSGLSCIFCNAEALRILCSGDPLATDLTASKWTTIYGQSNDTIVPLDSALNNLAGLQYSGVIHTAALETLNFNGPSVLDPASGISSEVINLLNEVPTGTDFH